MALEDVTLDQLRAATKEQIITVIRNKLENLTKKQLIVLVLKIAGVDIDSYELTEVTVAEDGPNGQVTRVYVSKDALGNKLKSLRVNWEYYLTGEIDTIVLSDLDANDVVTVRRVIRHFLDGRQPTLTTEE